MPATIPTIAPASPSPLVRGIVSVLVTGHLVAILVAVSSYSSPTFPAPQLAAQASVPLQPYLQATFLNNAYRFFAPNPGTPAVFWFRVQFEDRSIRWFELPGPPDLLVREPYQRRLNLSVQLAQYLSPTPTGDGKQTLTSIGELLLQSCVRHIAQTQRQTRSLGVRNIGAYCVLHRVILPAEARAGWEQTDLRTYQPLFVGAYTADGERVDEFQPAAKEQPIAHVVAGIVEVDVLPHKDTVESLNLPEPVQRFVNRHSELRTAKPGDGLRKQIETLISQNEESAR